MLQNVSDDDDDDDDDDCDYKYNYYAKIGFLLNMSNGNGKSKLTSPCLQP